MREKRQKKGVREEGGLCVRGTAGVKRGRTVRPEEKEVGEKESGKRGSFKILRPQIRMEKEIVKR